jgi:hypothetical protein
MRSRFDQFAKQMARTGLAPGGTVETDAEVSPDAHRIDVWFTPNPDLPASTLTHLGLLGRIARAACTIEPFHQTPGGDETMGCVAKHHFFCKALARREPAPPLPVQWIVSSGLPTTALAGLHFVPSTTWGPGVYEGPPLTRTSLVAVSELPETRDTLLVRLWGAGRTLARAIAELRGLPADAPERLLAMPILLRLRLEVPADRARRSPDDEEFVMSTQDIVEVWTQKVRDETLAEAVLTLYEARFGAPPSEVASLVRQTHEQAILRGWLIAVGTGTAAEVAAAFRR